MGRACLPTPPPPAPTHARPTAAGRRLACACVQPMQGPHGRCSSLHTRRAAALGEGPLSKASRLLRRLPALLALVRPTTHRSNPTAQPHCSSNNHIGADLDQAGLGLAAVMNFLFSLCKTWLREGRRGEGRHSVVPCTTCMLRYNLGRGLTHHHPALPPPLLARCCAQMLHTRPGIGRCGDSVPPIQADV